jgi:hypothetical protein
MTNAFLAGRRIAISISDAPEMGARGLGKEHLEDAMTEIARHLLAWGAQLAYGGDLRPGGFTELLFELVNRYRRNEQIERIVVRNFLAWPVHASMPSLKAMEWQNALKGVAELVFLAPDGKPISEKHAGEAVEPTPSEWRDGLTAMRKRMASETDARIVLGGRTAGFKGRFPGIAEEALIQLERKAPLYVLGGFGGCSLDIAAALGLSSVNGEPSWEGLEYFTSRRPEHLRNGLGLEENVTLARTVHADESCALIMRGLLRTLGQNSR